MATINIEMSEQVPLNPEPTQPAEGGAAGETGAPAADKKGKSWFFKKGKAANSHKTGEGAEGQTETAIVETQKEGEGGAAAEKKNHWWNRKCTKPECTEANANQGLSYGVNLIQRDDRQLQTGIDLSVEDIYGEPDSMHSLNGIWKTNYAVFQVVRSFTYKVFSTIVAIPLAVIFGILFALVSAVSVFLCVPAGRLLSIPVGWIAKVWSVVISTVCDPVFQSIGYLFSNVRVSRYGINSDPTAVISAP